MSFAVAKYRSAKTTTASPVQIVVQLYEGALKYLRQAQECVGRKDYAAKGMALRKAHAIITELQATLRPEHAPELCEQLYALYDFALFRITETNLEKRPRVARGSASGARRAPRGLGRAPRPAERQRGQRPGGSAREPGPQRAEGGLSMADDDAVLAWVEELEAAPPAFGPGDDLAEVLAWMRGRDAVLASFAALDLTSLSEALRDEVRTRLEAVRDRDGRLESHLEALRETLLAQADRARHGRKATAGYAVQPKPAAGVRRSA